MVDGVNKFPKVLCTLGKFKDKLSGTIVIGSFIIWGFISSDERD